MQPNPPNVLERVDLLAVMLLDVRFSPPAVRDLVEAPTVNWSQLLSAVPADVDLWRARAKHLTAVETAWTELRSVPGIDRVIAGKVLARKRPRLVPIVDSVIERAVQAFDGTYWATIKEYTESAGNRREIEALRPLGVSRTVASTLRLLDAAIWMSASRSRNARAARRSCGYPS
jgi:hypothetical protein